MSADDNMTVQVNSRGQLVAQRWFQSSDDLPDPEEARPEEIFENTNSMFSKTHQLARATEYGYQFHLDSLPRPDMTIDDRLELRRLQIKLIEPSVHEPQPEVSVLDYH